jgi:prophage antirepressor-like protein
MPDTIGSDTNWHHSARPLVPSSDESGVYAVLVSAEESEVRSFRRTVAGESWPEM